MYFKQPDKEAVIFDTVPALAAQFKKLYPRIEPPGQWPSIYDVTVLGDDNGSTTFRLVPKKNGRIEHLDVKADDAIGDDQRDDLDVRGRRLRHVRSDRGDRQRGNVLIKSQTGHVELPSYKADVQHRVTRTTS